MKDLSFLDKLKVLVDVSSSSGLCIASIFILLFLAFIMLTTNKKNSKHTKRFYLIIYIILIVVMLIQYSSSLSTMFDYMMNNLFIAIYFPNLAIYLAAIIATNIILWKTIFNFKEDKLLKVVNTIIYSIMHYLLILILNVVNSNGLDVFNNASVYENNDALALIGLSSTIFMIWIIFMVIYKIIRGRQKQYEEQSIKDEQPIRTKLPSNIIEVAVPKRVKEVIKIREEVVPKIVQEPSIVDFYKQDQDEIEKYENMLTLDDYKTVLQLLKNNKSNLTIENTEDEYYEKETYVNESSVEYENKANTINNFNDNYYYEDNYDDIVEQPMLDKLLNLYKSV